MKHTALVTAILLSGLIIPSAQAAPGSLPNESTEATKQLPAISKHWIELKKESPGDVFVTVIKDGEETTFNLTEDELKDAALIDNKLAAFDDATRADIQKTLKSLSEEKIHMLNAGDKSQLKALKLAWKTKDKQLEAQGSETEVRSEDTPQMKEEIRTLVFAGIHEGDLDDADGHHTIVIRQGDDDGEISQLQHISVDTTAIHFKVLKELLQRNKLTDAQKDELRALLDQ